MKSASKMFLFPLIILLLFTTVPAVHAQTECTPLIAGKSIEDSSTPVINCGEPPICYSGEIKSVDHPNEQPAQVDYYAVDLVAGQVLTIDVDAEELSSLDSFLEIFDSAGNSLGGSNDDPAPGETSVVDPYFLFTVPADGGGIYKFAISAAGAPGTGLDIGAYSFFLGCTVPSAPPVQIDYLLGATGGDPGSLVSIDPASGVSSPRFPLGVGPIADIEFDPSSDSLLVAVEAVAGDEPADNIPASITAIDPNSGDQFDSYSLATESVVALEAAGDKLYGVRVDSSGAKFSLALVTFDIDLKVANLTDVVLFDWLVGALAYHSVEKVMYGVASVAGVSNLVTIDLESLAINIVGPTGFGQFVALDFSNDNLLFGVDRAGILYELDPTTGAAVAIGPISASAEVPTNATAQNQLGITGLTFVVEQAPQNEEPLIKTICSSSFTDQTAASSESVNSLTRTQLKRNPRNSAVGLFKFQGEADEILNLSVCLEEKEAVTSEEASTSNWIQKLWPNWEPKKRVFVVIRDAIPDLEFRVKQKRLLTQDEPTLEIKDVQLPATGSYYIMVIRPFRRLNSFDYCLSLESLNGTAGDSLVVAWPNDGSEESPPATSTEAKTAEVQSDDPVVEGSTGTGDTTPIEPAGVAPALTTAEAVSVAPASDASEPVDEVGSQEMLPVDKSTVETEEVAPVEKTTEVTEEPVVTGAPEITEETTADVTDLVAPVEKTTEVTEEPMVTDAPEITKETTVDVTEVVPPAEEPTDPVTVEEPTMAGAPEIPEETTVDVTEVVPPTEEPTAETTVEPTEEAPTL